MQTDVTPDSRMEEILKISGKPIFTCMGCNVPFVTSPNYTFGYVCIDCSDSRHSYDREKRTEMQRGYHAKRKKLQHVAELEG